MIPQYLFLVAGAVVLLRFIKGPSTSDRLITLNVLTSLLVMLLVWHSVQRGLELYLDISIAMAMLSFVGMLALIRWGRK